MVSACGSKFRLAALCAFSTTCRSFSTKTLQLPRRQNQQTVRMASTPPPLPVFDTSSISSKIKATLDPCVVLMKSMVGQYAEEWKEKGGIFSLAQGVVYWKPPPSANEAIRNAMDDEDNSMLHLYGPDEGLDELREGLTQKLATENGLLDHHVMVTAGANQAYMNCVLTLLNDDDKAVVFAPYYFNHVMALQMTLPESGILVGPSSDTGLPNLQWLEEQLQKTKKIKVVTLVNPGNPTGTLLDREFLQRSVDLCRKYGTWLILDCTYEYFVPNADFDGCFHEDPHVIHIFSFSKAYALAGYRVGYMAIPKQAGDLYDQIMKVQDTIPICPSRIAQIAAHGSMSAGKDWVRDKIASLDDGREAILGALSSLEVVMGGSGAMYVMGKLREGTDDKELTRRLVQEFGVACIPGSFCGFPGWIRVCYSNLPPEKCKEAAARLKAGLESLQA